MKISFVPLAESHFPLLLKWLEMPHVKKWWDQDVKWTLALIQEKYSDYVKGYKLDNGISKPIKAYIICAEAKPIGYVQIYNVYDFAREEPLTGLPSSLAGFDLLIGDEAYLKQGIGSQAIAQFIKEHGISYTHVFADPDSNNIAAIKAYEKAGFRKCKKQPSIDEVWMLWKNKGVSVNNAEHFNLDENENPEVRSILNDGLKDFNKSKIGAYEHDPFTLYIKTEGKVVGGCYGDITKDNCYMDCIWVDSQYRGKGLAKSLMSKLEDYAKQKHCSVITLETADFQAKDFYTKIGFSTISTYPHNCFLGHQVYLMRKKV
ncbi:MAG: GNAT family N-acetyltransferase [Gammaproteobacteria bacterium]|nr:GNAT family N-acetyltransferase [Gammaproteobacteria bacterium]